MPADGFYEWKALEHGKQPYFVRPRRGGPIAFAGLWETWIGPNGEEMDTACIITTAANRTLAPIHDRMPVVIAPENFDLWLDCRWENENAAAGLIAPPSDDLFEAYEISTAVNRVANDSPALIAPLQNRESMISTAEPSGIKRKAPGKSKADPEQKALPF